MSSREREQEFLRMVFQTALATMHHEGMAMPDHFLIQADYGKDTIGVDGFAPGVEPDEEWNENPNEPYFSGGDVDKSNPH